MPPVTPADVAVRFPKAPVVSVDDVQEAQDWAELNLTGAVPEAGTLKARALLRAIMAYAVALALGLDVQSIRMTAAGTSATKKIKVGPIELEKVISSRGDTVVDLLASAEDWLERAELALQQAGTYPQRRLFPGTSR